MATTRLVTLRQKLMAIQMHLEQEGHPLHEVDEALAILEAVSKTQNYHRAVALIERALTLAHLLHYFGAS